MSSGEAKRPTSGSERQQKYKEKKSAFELNQLKQNIKRAKLKETDLEKAETVRLEKK